MINTLKALQDLNDSLENSKGLGEKDVNHAINLAFNICKLAGCSVPIVKNPETLIRLSDKVLDHGRIPAGTTRKTASLALLAAYKIFRAVQWRNDAVSNLEKIINEK